MEVGGEESEASDSGEESGGESAPSTPSSALLLGGAGKRVTRSSTGTGGHVVWPSLADVNTRARRLVSAWLKLQRREESRLAHLRRETEKKEREAEALRRREQKKAELALKWSKREEQDFLRVISSFGVEFDRAKNKYNWTRFRQLANLSKKSDERLSLYLQDFRQMCERVMRRKKIRRGLSGMRVEPVTEERAARCLQKIDLISAVREEILPHPRFDELLQLCEVSFEVPQWWLPREHDQSLLVGVAKHGLSRSDQLIYNDPELSFKETVPQTALFDPTSNQVVLPDDASSGSEGEEGESGVKVRPTSSNPVPLGWPKEKAILIRMTRIVYAFRNGVWPKPMEGLDLFVPTFTPDQASSSESESSDSDSGSELLELLPPDVGGHHQQKSPLLDVEGDRDFEIEKSQGLKLTLKKSTPKVSREDDLKLVVTIPLVKLTFPSRQGLKKIPKKRPAERSALSPPSDAKRHRKQGSPAASSKIIVVDPTTISSCSELTGQERVGVINRNTQDKLPLNHSPMLKNLRLWLDGHPHFNVEPQWGALVREWGALRPHQHHRILPVGAPLSPPLDPVLS